MDDRHIWKISEVNSAVRDLVENSLMPFWVQGEVGTLSIHRSGHVYMTLKDERSQIRAVFFGGAAQARKMNLKVGAQIEAYGKLTVYEVRGEYQFSVKMLRPLGIGDLQRQFEELKSRLAAEGLFESERKKPIPALPRKIGVVTSADGAAIRDFLQIIDRRFPDVNVKIYPAPVQGDGAGEKVARGVEFFNRHRNVDVLVVTRGGGSMEDLWPFNSEVLARAIAASEIPVISAVGHEIDFTISDFVADMRVPTPSAAAELVIGQQEDLKDRLERATKSMVKAINYTIERLWRRLDSLSGSYVFKEPEYIIRQKQQRLDELLDSMSQALVRAQEKQTHRLEQLNTRLGAIKPERYLTEQAKHLDNLQSRLQEIGQRQIERKTALLEQLNGKLSALSPYNVLKRGYAMLTDQATGQTVQSADVLPGTLIDARVADGTIEMEVKSSQKTS